MILLLAIVFSFGGCMVIAAGTYVAQWVYCVDDFELHKEEFEAIADFCQEYLAEQGNTGNESWTFRYDEERERLLCTKTEEPIYSTQKVTLPNEIQACFEKIEPTFWHEDAKLYAIICVGETVYFTTHNNLYSVVYSPEGIPGYLDGVKEGMTLQILGDWYHVVEDIVPKE